jgi:hypothetical protein
VVVVEGLGNERWFCFFNGLFDLSSKWCGGYKFVRTRGKKRGRQTDSQLFFFRLLDEIVGEMEFYLCFIWFGGYLQ